METPLTIKDLAKRYETSYSKVYSYVRSLPPTGTLRMNNYVYRDDDSTYRFTTEAIDALDEHFGYKTSLSEDAVEFEDIHISEFTDDVPDDTTKHEKMPTEDISNGLSELIGIIKENNTLLISINDRLAEIIRMDKISRAASLLNTFSIYKANENKEAGDDFIEIADNLAKSAMEALDDEPNIK